MVKDVVVPDIGDYQNVEIIEIMVKVGEQIAVDDELLTIETDKAAMAIPANIAGTVTKLHVKVGDKVSRGSLILTIDEAIAANATPTMPVVEIAATATAAPAPTLEQIIFVPDIGVSGKVAIIEVQVKVGEQIKVDQPLITLESEKAAMEIPAPSSGVVSQIFVKAGDKIGTGEQILSLTTTMANTAVPGKQETASQPIHPKAASHEQSAKDSQHTQHAKHAGLGHAGPAVRRFARELGVELTKVTGSARKGRILRQDVTKYVKEVLTTGHTQSAHHHSNFNVAEMPNVNFSDFGSVTTAPLSRIKKLSGNFLHRNWVRIPHVTQFDEADITELENFRLAQKALADKHGIKLTPIVFLMKAVVAGLKAFPIFNSSLSKDGEQLIMKNYYHIGVAVDTPNGLVVPVVRDVDTKGLFELAQDLAKLGARAREGKLTASEMQGGCFSISSLGGIGGTAFTPIVNAPEVAILGVSKAKMQPLYRDNTFVPRLMLPLSLSYDHRVIDGADAARFCAFIADQLSDIRRLLL
jgi:pyruvate dehydrogenase E2 component (dihydrolipoamide acetyltransferase)